MTKKHPTTSSGGLYPHSQKRKEPFVGTAFIEFMILVGLIATLTIMAALALGQSPLALGQKEGKTSENKTPFYETDPPQIQQTQQAFLLQTPRITQENVQIREAQATPQGVDKTYEIQYFTLNNRIVEVSCNYKNGEVVSWESNFHEPNPNTQTRLQEGCAYVLATFPKNSNMSVISHPHPERQEFESLEVTR